MRTRHRKYGKSTVAGKRSAESRCDRDDASLMFRENTRLEDDGFLKGCDLGGKRRRITTTNSTSGCYFQAELLEKRQKGLKCELLRDEEGDDLLDFLSDDLVILILSYLSSTASGPSDLGNVRMTCKRLNRLGLDRIVLSKASLKSMVVSADRWSERVHRFLNMCAASENLDACYMLGMIHFYCLENKRTGAFLMAKAAMGLHAEALYSLAIIQFNGSGGSKIDKDIPSGFSLCARAALLKHVDGIREVGHCLKDGYGVLPNHVNGHRFLLIANALELSTMISSATNNNKFIFFHENASSCSLWRDILTPPIHPVNRFLIEWFAGKQKETIAVHDDKTVSFRLCSNIRCGRPETRRHEFRRCSVCGAVNYCSRSCQAIDWKLIHKVQCVSNVGRRQQFVG